MEIKISDNRKLKDIQDEFHKHFPNLKLEFFKEKAEGYDMLAQPEILFGELTIGKARKRHNSGHVNIYPFQTVAAIEEMFEKKFGLHAQVLRKAGKSWLVTGATDGWTLKKENEVGGEIITEPVIL